MLRGKMDSLLALCTIVFAIWILQCGCTNTDNHEEWSRERQLKLLATARDACLKKISFLDKTNANGDGNGGTHCAATWDRIQCWNKTPANTLVTQNCPDYFYGFDKRRHSTKYCTDNGAWFVHPHTDSQWTNFTRCRLETTQRNSSVPEFIIDHIREMVIMCRVGYGLSLICLVLAVIIILSLKRLHCHRNRIHTNLFISYIVRAVVYLIKESVMVQGLAPRNAVIVHENGPLEFIDEGSHWGCKLLYTLVHYTIAATTVWIFAEGLYLHAIIYWDKIAHKIRLLYLALFIWGFPLLSVIPYVIARVLFDNSLCWNTHTNYPQLYWILRAPLVCFILINFVFFVNIIRALYTKLSAGISMEKRRSRKLAKSTLVLIPLFGVQYIVFIALPDNVDERLDFIKTYVEMFCNSFHGVVIALLFCFLNSEVQHEIMKKWRRYRLRTNANFSDPSPQIKSVARSEQINTDIAESYYKVTESISASNYHVCEDVELKCLLHSPNHRDYDNNLCAKDSSV